MYPVHQYNYLGMYRSDYQGTPHYLASPPKADDATAADSCYQSHHVPPRSASMLHFGGNECFTPHPQTDGLEPYYLRSSCCPKQANEHENSSAKMSQDDESGFDYKNVMLWLNQQACGGTAKRKRKINRKQRSAANQRERRRMIHLNVAFEKLRQRIPTFPHEKKLSRIQTLKFAIDYISLMTDIVRGQDGEKSPETPTSAVSSPQEQTETRQNDHYWA